jgi:hypothetical protein
MLSCKWSLQLKNLIINIFAKHNFFHNVTKPKKQLFLNLLVKSGKDFTPINKHNFLSTFKKSG